MNVLACLLFVASGQEVFSLGAARAAALDRRPELTAASARVESAAASAERAEAASRPKVAGTLELSAAPGGLLVELPAGELLGIENPLLVQGSPTLDQGSAAFAPQLRYAGLVGVEWMLLDFGRAEAAVRAARAERRAREAEVAATSVGLVRAVDGAYLEWLAATERVAHEAEAQRAVVARKAAVVMRIEEGALAPSARWALETEVASHELRLAHATHAAENAALALSEAVGGLPAGAAPDRALLELGAERSLQEPEDPALDALGARIDALSATVDLEERAGLPALGIDLQVGLRGQELSLFPVYRGALSLKLPIWDGGERDAEVERARAERRALAAEQARAEDQRTRRQEALRLRLRHARDRVVLASRLVEAARGRLEDAEQRLDQDAATEDEVARARAEWIRAEGELLAARVDRAAASLELTR